MSSLKEGCYCFMLYFDFSRFYFWLRLNRSGTARRKLFFDLLRRGGDNLVCVYAAKFYLSIDTVAFLLGVSQRYFQLGSM